ncbi:MAG: LLM class flavin-dependent oxidoreductase [Chloroflexi bacterium]|nr:LLM class flavin-dependent oxidoreductase [Chloroflexota bacterium]
MKFSAMYHLGNPHLRPSVELFDRAFEQIELLKDIFDGVWCTEHHFSNFGLIGSPLIFLTKVATMAPRLRVGPAVLVLPIWQSPVRLAEELGTLDTITHGRLDVGIGRGYQAHEYGGYGVAAAESRDRFNEVHEILIRTWTQEDWTFTGKYYQITEPVTLEPRPLQQPHPPIWVAAHSPETIEFAARYGYHLMQGGQTAGPVELAEVRRDYDERLRSHGYDPATRELFCNRMVYCTEDPKEAEAALEWGWWRIRQAQYMHVAECQVERGLIDASSYDYPFSSAAVERVMIVGSPERCAARIRELSGSGVTYVNCNFDIEVVARDRVLESVRLFVDEVLPRVQPAGVR